MNPGYYRVGQYYFDTAAKVLYRCTTAGSASTSVWAAVTGAGGVTAFRIVTSGTFDGGDYYNCNQWTGSAWSASITKVAKQYKMMCISGPTSETIRGGTYNYSYSQPGGTGSEYVRATTGSASSTDYPTPPALPGDVIYAEPLGSTPFSSLSAVLWIEKTPREWASA